jgi:hypothetical protein
MEANCQLHDPAALPLGKEPPVPNEKVGGVEGGPQSRSGGCGEEKKILASAGHRTPVSYHSSQYKNSRI